ncbi:MAG: prepilin-type N-terminal cleavage/methylation domain-containing protein [Armatimonadetes bacterium]|nr:prepilin-type N-terminal cleavage/methylation domain-containing protein [Armatimonadota bacterium]MBS1710109.1 prepilin-type N-terminal cleavage/methylation domain-containing protein [Armatimonadota bacterium]MBX3109999.1 prepilin-type N-terminal cleavage/methylation domain-containing protein [Fimbriimonadaceae bacterium]
MRRAFTLIELLVVIAIIAILAAILFPVFAQAKVAAKKSADLSNTKQIGIGLQLYLSDFDDIYPMANYRNNDNAAFGEVHWSWMVLPYMKNEQIFVSPSDKNGGWAPSCWDPNTNNRGFGVPGVQSDVSSAAACALAGYNAGIYTTQVGRISYTGNQLLMPRKRVSSDTSTTVSQTQVDDVSGTILLAPTTESKQCMQRSGEYRTYRNAIGISKKGQVPDGFSSAPTAAADLPLEAISVATAKQVFACNTGTVLPSSLDHTLRYTHVGRYDRGNNYVFSDTSARFRETYSTLNPARFAWGKSAYSLGGSAIVDPLTGNPVQ